VLNVGSFAGLGVRYVLKYPIALGVGESQNAPQVRAILPTLVDAPSTSSQRQAVTSREAGRIDSGVTLLKGSGVERKAASLASILLKRLASKPSYIKLELATP
jgi:hypothetical protein